MPENFKMGTNAVGEKKSKKRFEKPLTLKTLTNWIRQQGWDEYTKKELIKKASAYPYNSLRYFADQVNAQVIKINEERTKLREEKDEREQQMREKEEKSKSSTGNNTQSS